jgi:vitamin-K-epoxide reductase (warfarin-sensitive)
LRTIIFLLAVAGVIVSSLAWQIHYSNKVEPCDINARWDCGIVNHSRYSMIHGVPVAAIGVAGYLLIALLAFFRKRLWTLAAALAGLAFALYLSHIEASILEVWCLYCVISQGIIALIAILALIGVITNEVRKISDAVSRVVDWVVTNMRYG